MSDAGRGAPAQIGTLGEKSLHAALKEYYSQPGDGREVTVEGFVVDIVHGDRLVEIQTRHLYAMRRKVARLLEQHTLEIIVPIAVQKWIVRQSKTGEVVGRRKSPKKGRPIELFTELVRVPEFLNHKRLDLRVALTWEEEVWRDDGQGSWRRRYWSVHDRRLLKVAGERLLHGPDDYLSLLPADLPQHFTNKQLAAALNCRPALAQKMTYTLRRAGLLQLAGKRGRAHLHQRV